MYIVHVQRRITIRKYTYEWFRPSLGEKEDTVMRVKRWFYRGGHPNRVARIPDRDTAALYAKQARGWEGDWHAALQDRRPPGLRRRRRVRLARRLEIRAHRGRGPCRLGAGGPLGAGQLSWRPGRRAGTPGAARRLRPDGRRGRAARTGRVRADRGVVDVFRPVPEPLWCARAAVAGRPGAPARRRVCANPLGVRLGFRPRAARLALGSCAPRGPVREGACAARWVGYLLPASALWVLVGS